MKETMPDTTAFVIAQHDPDYLDDSSAPSKSQRKREALARQKLGEQLVKLTAPQLKRVGLSEELLGAVQLAQRVTQRGGHKRQLQYIGKLMRELDPDEIAAIQASLATMLGILP